ncbi:MAG: formate dehydrogenase [Planctomycetes bacterium]|nr:formate dehydrogenase [Planctomycetota bacterium]
MERKQRSERQLAASWVPFGLGLTKPKHFREMAKIVWENRDNLRYGWKVLSQGVCDGCALGTTGLKDWTVEGTHLCMVRLELLRLNTMGALDPAVLGDVEALRRKSSKELRELGRLPYPMRRRRGEPGFSRVSWEELWAEVGEKWRGYDPDRTAMFVTSRGLTNENYYVAGKVMRFLGSPHVDNSARLCHSPSTAGLKATVGVAATTCSYKDWFDSDLIVFLGSNPANDQPVTTKYLMHARKRGARVITVNAYREPGMKRYWIPSSTTSALFGTTISDRDYMVKIGGDLAFLNAAAKLLIERGAVHTEFLDAAVEGYEDFQAKLARQSIDELCTLAGVERAEVEAFADEFAQAEKGVLVWSMGITQHPHGADTVKAIANLGLLKEWVGRDGCGLMPIRGHSGVQGGAEMGAYSTALPGGLEVNEENARRFEELWGFPVPHEPGMTTVDYLEAAIQGQLDALYCIGGNFLETMPSPDRIAEGLGRIPLRIHSDIVLTNQMLVDPADTVFLLPARTRYEQEGGGTETSTERRVIYSPHIPGHQVGEAQDEWRMMLALAEAVKGDDPACPRFVDGDAVRAEIAQAVPSYAGIEKLKRKGDEFQWGGPHLCADRQFPTADGKAHLVPVRPPFLGEPHPDRAQDEFTVTTRRGKQFNSMVQRARDPLTGAMRDHVFMHADDAAALGLRADDRIVLENETGSMEGRVFLAEVTRGTLQAHWPEVNVVIPHGSVDAGGGVPNYNAVVKVARIGKRGALSV